MRIFIAGLSFVETLIYVYLQSSFNLYLLRGQNWKLEPPHYQPLSYCQAQVQDPVQTLLSFWTGANTIITHHPLTFDHEGVVQKKSANCKKS